MMTGLVNVNHDDINDVVSVPRVNGARAILGLIEDAYEQLGLVSLSQSNSVETESSWHFRTVESLYDEDKSKDLCHLKQIPPKKQ
ncbi:unnamed protein product [Sympodiomycopsis kandeliae]